MRFIKISIIAILLSITALGYSQVREWEIDRPMRTNSGLSMGINGDKIDSVVVDSDTMYTYINGAITPWITLLTPATQGAKVDSALFADAALFADTSDYSTNANSAIYSDTSDYTLSIPSAIIVDQITINDSIVDTVYSGTLISKEFADSTYSGMYTFTNGLTKTGNDVTLGGTLTGNTLFENQDFYYMEVSSAFNDNVFRIDHQFFNSYYESGNLNTSINQDFNTYNLTMQDDVTGYTIFNESEISATVADQIISVNDNNGDVLQFQFNTDNGVIFTDEIYGKGLMYPADYSLTFGDSSLITKKFADDNYIDTSSGVINDIQMSDGSGGFLNADDILTGSIFDFDGEVLNITDGTSNNVVIGNDATSTGTIGANNTIIGSEAAKNITGNSNVVIGRNAALTIGAAASNVVIGVNAGGTNQSNSVIIGSQAGNSSSSDNSTFIGLNSGYNSTGDENTFYGFGSGFTNTTGVNNTFIGHESGYTNSTGFSNVFLGFESGKNEVNPSNKLIIGNSATNKLIEGDFLADSVQIDGGINVTGVTKLQDKIYAYDLDTIQNEYSMYLNPTTKEITAREPTHLFSYFDVTYDPGLILQNDWYHLTNATNDYLTTIEFENIGGRNDSIILLQDGHYKFSFNVTFEGGNGDDYEFRFFNVTQNEAVYGTLTANSFGTGKPLSLAGISYCLNCNQFDFIVPQYRNIDNDDNDFLLIGGSALIEMTHAE